MIAKWLLGLVVFVTLLAGGLFVAGKRQNAGRHEGQIVLQVPAAAVFPWLLEVQRRKRWQAGLSSVEWISGDGPATGAVATEVVDLDGQRTELRVEYTELVPASLIALKMSSDGDFPFQYRVRWELSEQDGKTHLRCVCDGQYETALLQLMEPLLALAANAKLAADLQTLKSLVEGTPS